MNNRKIYIKGLAGFKPAVKAKLGDAWVLSDTDVNMDTVMLVMAPESRLEALKASVGDDLISVYELQFLTNLDEFNAMEVSKGKRTDEPLRMSIWTSKDSNIRTRNPQQPQHDPSAVVF